MTRASKIRLLRDTGIISHDPAGECSLHYRNVSKSPRAPRGPLYKRGLLGPLLYQRRDREDFASSIAMLAPLPPTARLRPPKAGAWLPHSKVRCRGTAAGTAAAVCPYGDRVEEQLFTWLAGRTP